MQMQSEWKIMMYGKGRQRRGGKWDSNESGCRREKCWYNLIEETAALKREGIKKDRHKKMREGEERQKSERGKM